MSSGLDFVYEEIFTGVLLRNNTDRLDDVGQMLHHVNINHYVRGVILQSLCPNSFLKQYHWRHFDSNAVGYEVLYVYT